MKNIPEHVLKNGPWSISKIGVIEKCSQQFKFKHVDRLKELVTFEESRVGVAVHKALELALDGTSIRDAFTHASDQSELTTDELDQLNAFYDQVDRFVKRMFLFRRKNGVLPQNVFIERKWAVDTDFNKASFFDNEKAFFRGVVDYGLLTGKNDLIIIDHKSGKEKELSYYTRQFRAYAVMALAMYPEIRGVQTAVNFIQTDNLAWNPYAPAEKIRNEYVPALIQDMTSACESLLKPPEAKKGWYCAWCGFKPICPAFNGGTTNAAEGE